MADKITSALGNSFSSINEKMTAFLGEGWLWIVLVVLLLIFVLPSLGIWEEEQPID